MRTRRILGEGPSCYHVMSRIVDRRFIFDDKEKECFRDLMRRLERFSGIEILTYSIMSNHFHILVRIPEPVVLSDAELKNRLQAIYCRSRVREIMDRIAGYREEGRSDLAESCKYLYQARMYNLPCFAKELKQRFTQGYNRRHARSGTLWEERYRSVLVEGSGRAIVTVAAYIDLNAVRAGICDDPADYRYCGYGEAVCGGGRARWGIARTIGAGVGQVQPDKHLDIYRSYMVYDPEASPSAGCRVRGEPVLSVKRMLRARVRYFSYGAVLGSQHFVDEFFVRCRDHLGCTHQTSAKPMVGGDWQGLCVLRDSRCTDMSQ